MRMLRIGVQKSVLTAGVMLRYEDDLWTTDILLRALLAHIALSSYAQVYHHFSFEERDVTVVGMPSLSQ